MLLTAVEGDGVVTVGVRQHKSGCVEQCRRFNTSKRLTLDNELLLLPGRCCEWMHVGKERGSVELMVVRWEVTVGMLGAFLAALVVLHFLRRLTRAPVTVTSPSSPARMASAGSPIAVCVYGAIGRAYPAAWRSQSRYIIDPLRRLGFDVEVRVWEQVDDVFDGRRAPTNCQDTIGKHAVSYVAKTSEELDLLVDEVCARGNPSSPGDARRDCLTFCHPPSCSTYAYRTACLESLVADFLVGFVGWAVVFSGDFVFASEIDAKELVDPTPGRVVLLDRDYYTFGDFEGAMTLKDIDGAEPDGFYMGDARYVEKVLRTLDYARSRRQAHYEVHIGMNIRDNNLVPHHSSTLRSEKLRRTGDFREVIVPIGNDSACEAEALERIYERYRSMLTDIDGE